MESGSTWSFLSGFFPLVKRFWGDPCCHFLFLFIAIRLATEWLTLTLLPHSATKWYSECSRFGAIMKSTALNVHLQVFMQDKGSVDHESSPSSPQRCKLFFRREHTLASGWALLDNDGQCYDPLLLRRQTDTRCLRCQKVLGTIQEILPCFPQQGGTKVRWVQLVLPWINTQSSPLVSRVGYFPLKPQIAPNPLYTVFPMYT